MDFKMNKDTHVLSVGKKIHVHVFNTYNLYVLRSIKYVKY